MRSREVGRDAGALRLDDECNSCLAEQHAEAREEWVCLIARSPVMQFVLEEYGETATTRRSAGYVSTCSPGQDPPVLVCWRDTTLRITRQGYYSAPVFA